MSWSEFERHLSDRRPAGGRPARRASRANGTEGEPRTPLVTPASSPRRGGVYAELHCHTHYSFLDGASSPEALVAEAVRLELDALAVTDHNGFYGVVRFAEAARAVGLPTVFGAELSLHAETPRAAAGAPPDPSGRHMLILARDPEGYAQLASLITAGQMAGEKNLPRLSFADVAEAAGRARGHWAVLTGCRKGLVPSLLSSEGPQAAERELRSLVAAFSAENVFVELWNHDDPLDSARNDALARLAVAAKVGVVATNNVHYATPRERRLAAAMAAIRSRRSLDEIDGWLPASGSAHLRGAQEQHRRFARYPGVVEAAAALGRECAFDLALVAPSLPPYPCPVDANGAATTEMAFLRALVEDGGTRRYGSRRAERVTGAWAQIDHELDLIEKLGFAGYFLIVWDIVEFCRRQDILCQGRGSAANSAVCYSLGVTCADAVRLGLLFERFLSPERDGPPDIDLDIESGRREEAIQYVYDRYGRSHAAQVANVITYRPRSSVRDAARALGHSPGQQDAWAKEIGHWGPLPVPGEVGLDGEPVGIPNAVLDLAGQLLDRPRHLGIHSGGMVICDRPVIEVCPVEWAAMADRSVLQWDKEDCAASGLVKFDLLGLGMLSALHYTVDHVKSAHGVDVDLAALEQEDAVYDMLCRADSVGVFQVESRAQMGTLPRLRPRCFYDLVVEVALIRPGPIQGGSVHPYIRRRKGIEPVTYLHPLLERSLSKTLGIPLFQEQLMQIAIDVGGFTPAEADQLRQAMAAKRSRERMEALAQRFLDGAAQRGVEPDVGEQIWEKLSAFANYGFPESHSVSFAYLVYASAWLKYHYPAAFCAGLLDAQPMGFYSPHSLVQDARRHGVMVRTPDVNASDWCSTLEWEGAPVPPRRLSPRFACNLERQQPVLRLGLREVRTVGDDLAKDLAAGRPWRSPEDLVRRGGVNRKHVEALATAGALSCFSSPEGGPLSRRQALWSAGAASQTDEGRLEGIVTGVSAPRLPGMDDWEVARADLWATGIAPDGHPTRFIRHRLAAAGAMTAERLHEAPDGSKVKVGGVVTHRQRPSTAGGITFMSMEDETGLLNVVVSPGCWSRYRRVATASTMVLVSGRLERSADGVVNVVAEKMEPMERVQGVGPGVTVAAPQSRDWR